MPAGDDLLFGIGAPQIHTRLPLDLEEIRRSIERAESLGFHSLWVQEQAPLRAAAGALEGISMLSYAAAITQRILLGNAVFLINLRNPIHLAKSLASLDQLSRGRLIVGVGLGGVTRLYQAYGLSAEHKVGRFVEALTLMKRLWTEENLDFEGKFWRLKKASLWPKPFQRPHPPIWFGANTAPALKRAVAHGSGFIGAGSASTADFKTNVQALGEALAEAKRDPATFMIGKRVYVAIDKDRAVAARRLREWFGLYYGQADLAERVSVWGSAEECAGGLRDIAAAGARLLVLNPVFGLLEQMEILASEVIPRVKDESGRMKTEG
ncbi:MAG: LLM class flavin-dependent oxidoreductase [Deltaproteobacteria bacterium]|nr:LLM class flavin-dependent oxidoreductase [Deltaproteobacteria bacterium]